jgi:hypothetical protein
MVAVPLLEIVCVVGVALPAGMVKVAALTVSVSVLEVLP